MTAIVFTSAFVLSGAATVAALLGGIALLPFLGLSVLINLWAVRQSDRKGFVRSKEMRRAYEPPRHFSSMQMLTLIAIVIVQIVVIMYVLIS